jgi:HemY protein
MRYWLAGLLLVIAMLAAAVGYHWLASDPGYVLVRLGNTHYETTAVVAVVALVVLWALVGVIWRLARWPLRLWFRRVRKKSRERLANGLVALAEGRYLRAEKELARATQYRELRAPAMLATARAALALGEIARADAALDEAAETAPGAALALRARLKRERGEHAEAYRLLAGEARTATLVPAAWVEFIEAALATGDVVAATNALVPLARAQALPPATFAALEARVLAAALAAQRSADGLNAQWAQLSRAQRRVPAALAAYARRVAALGQPLSGMSEIEGYLRKDWSEPVVQAYAELAGADTGARLRQAEGWLKQHPNSVVLLVALGRLCVAGRLWGKAREYLERALAISETAATWEALGDCHAGEGSHALAEHCYRNALRLARGETSEPLPGSVPRLGLDTTAAVIEERSEHGVPRLPDLSR